MTNTIFFAHCEKCVYYNNTYIPTSCQKNYYCPASNCCWVLNQPTSNMKQPVLKSIKIEHNIQLNYPQNTKELASVFDSTDHGSIEEAHRISSVGSLLLTVVYLLLKIVVWQDFTSFLTAVLPEHVQCDIRTEVCNVLAPTKRKAPRACVNSMVFCEPFCEPRQRWRIVWRAEALR